jgi:hypothetical protein
VLASNYNLFCSIIGTTSPICLLARVSRTRTFQLFFHCPILLYRYLDVVAGSSLASTDAVFFAITFSLSRLCLIRCQLFLSACARGPIFLPTRACSALQYFIVVESNFVRPCKCSSRIKFRWRHQYNFSSCSRFALFSSALCNHETTFSPEMPDFARFYCSHGPNLSSSGAGA